MESVNVGKMPMESLCGLEQPRNVVRLILRTHAYLVRVSVCLSLFYHHAQGDNKRSIPIGSALHWLDLKFGDFRMRKLCVKTSEKMTKAYLPRPRPLALCILKAQEVATKGVHRLPHDVYYCRYITRVKLPASYIARICTAHAQFAEGLRRGLFCPSVCLTLILALKATRRSMCHMPTASELRQPKMVIFREICRDNKQIALGLF